MPADVDARPGAALYPGGSAAFNPFNQNGFASAGAEAGPSSLRRPAMGTRGVSFAQSVGVGGGEGFERLAASRSQEENRGEPEAGQTATKKDMLGGEM